MPWTDGVGLETEPSGKVDDLHWGEGRLRRDEKLGVWGHVYFLLTTLMKTVPETERLLQKGRKKKDKSPHSGSLFI